MRIVFMGTPSFAVTTLDAIFRSEHEVVAVVTATDKPAGRGLQMKISEVKGYALEHNIPVYQPEKLKDPQFIADLKALNADIFVVVAFRMLPQEVYEIPPLGTFNVHASLLPQYRGAAPIHRAIMNGEKKTGVTTFFLNQTIDTGDIIASIEVPVGDRETTGELYEKLQKQGALLALDTIKLIENGAIKPIPQKDMDDLLLKPAPKITKQDALIHWDRPAQEIYNQIRGLNPFPVAYTRIKNNKGEEFTIKCFEAQILEQTSTDLPGKIITDGSRFFHICTTNKLISLQKIQWQGKNVMEIVSFLKGFRSENYTMILF